MTVSSANVMTLLFPVGMLHCKDLVKLHKLFTMGWGPLREFVLWILQSAVNLHLTQRRWCVRMDYSHIASHNPTTVQGHQRL